jgi:succinate dehydrogenase/fumarate reductase cytochrome b subunit
MCISGRVVDWTLLAGIVLLVTTGVVSLVAGSRGDAWLFVLHGATGVALVAFLALKLWRVRDRIRTGVRSRSGRAAISVLLAVLALGALATGLAWAFGASIPGPWTLLFVHMTFGVLVVPVFLLHLRDRLHLPSRRDLAGVDLDRRRETLAWTGAVAGGALAYRAQGAVNRALDTAGADRRFTGSRERGSDSGNRFPVTAWVADAPDRVDPDDWTLRVGGRVKETVTLGAADLQPDADDRAVLDCTSGWYSEHDWTGIRVGDLLDRAGVREAGRWVQFRSVTGYRWSLPLAEAREALLATHVDGERLSHGHGFPVRLVAPERRGFQWVKWVEAVRVTRRRDPSELVAIHVSGLGE